MNRSTFSRALVCVLALSGAQAWAAGPSLTSLKANKIVIQDVQAALVAQGYDKGRPTGTLNAKTTAALAKFAADKGLADKPIEAQLLALGIDLSTLEGIKLTTDGRLLRVNNGLDHHIDKLAFLYNWQSFEVGRYRVVDGEEIFKLDLAYCENFEGAPGSDCESGRHRVQIHDDSLTKNRHVLYAFEFLPENLPDVVKHIQFAELNQVGGFTVKHYETGVAGSATPRFTLEVQNGKYTVQDAALIDISLIGGSQITGADVPVEPGKWAKMEMEVNWSPEADGLFRYWVNGKPLWERKGRNATCLPSAKCDLSFKYGPYTGHLEQGTPDLKDNPIVFRYRGMTKVVGDADIATYLAGRDLSFAVNTARTGGATQAVRIVATAQIEHQPPPPQVNTLINAQITDGKPGENKVAFNIQGQLINGDFEEVDIVFNPPLGAKVPDGLAKCSDQPTTEWDGQQHAILTFKKAFRKVGTLMLAQHYTCMVKNVPPEVAFMMNFMVTSFKDLAADMATSGNIQTIQNDALRNWLLRVAEGEIAVQKPLSG
jgi:hypothetical protein